MTSVRLRTAIDLVDQSSAVERGEDGLPSAFRLLKFGVNDSENGKIKLDEKGAKQVVERYSSRGIELAIDYEHQTYSSETNGQPAPAAGWFRPEVRADGLWAIDVKWTEKAAALLTAREYRYFSPVVILDGDKRVVELRPIALTNLPALRGLQPLTLRHQEGKMDVTEEQLVTLRASDGFARDVLKLAGKDNHQEAIGTIAAWRSSHERVEQLSARVKEFEEQERKGILLRLEETGKLPKEGKLRAFAEGLEIVALRSFSEAAAQILPAVSLEQKPVPMRLSQEAQIAAAEKAVEDEMKSDPKISPAVAMMRAQQKNAALFDEGSTMNEGA